MSEAEERAASRSGEAAARQRVCAIARTWLGTPFRDQGKVKGPNGAVDCAMLLIATFQEAGLLDPSYDPRPYPPQFHLHRGEELFLRQIDEVIALRGCGAEKTNPAGLPAEALAQAGDVIVYKVARCFSHGGIILRQAQDEDLTLSLSNSEVLKGTHVLHAYYKTQHVAISPLFETELAFLPDGKPRPFKLFDLWASSE